MIDRLRELLARGYSFSEIGNELGVSKGSVAGKAHRLKLDARPLPIALEGVKNKPRVGSSARLRATVVRGFQVATVAHQSLMGVDAPSSGPSAAATAALVSFLPVGNSAAEASKPRPQLFLVRGCQYPLWKDQERPLYGEARFCDAPARQNEEGRQNSAYCPAHHALCFSMRGAAEDHARPRPKDRAWQGPPARGRFPAYV
jgi:GcrA cell cycle regulator